jgi:SAM-dependent methyltransferase
MPGADSFRASADAYDRHVGRYGPRLASALIAFAQIPPATRVLDVGCGPGALTAALAKRLGSASVCGADPSEPFAQPLPTGVAPSGAFCASLDDAGRAALHDAYRRRLGVADGPFELTARAWAVAGVVA